MFMNFMLLKFGILSRKVLSVLLQTLTLFVYPCHGLGRTGQKVQKRSGRVTKSRGMDIGD